MSLTAKLPLTTESGNTNPSLPDVIVDDPNFKLFPDKYKSFHL